MALPVLQLPEITPVSQSLLRAQQTNQSDAQTRVLDQEIALNQQKAQQQSALQTLTKEALKNPQAVQALYGVSPERGKQVTDFLDRQIMIQGRVAQEFDMMGIAEKEKAYPAVLKSLRDQNISTEGLPDTYDPNLVDHRVKFAIAQARDIEKRISQDKGLGGVDAPSAVREFEYYKSLPVSQQQEFLNVKRNTYQTGLTTDEQGNVITMKGIVDAKANIKTAESRAVEEGKLDVERRKNLAKANTALKSLETQSNIVTKNIDNALGTINKFSTGYGSYLSFLPNTDARKLKNYLDTIRANVGFDKLQQMRDNSPTGGALGQVSEMENKLLQAVNGALDPAQADQLGDNLKQIKSLYPKVLSERKEAFNADYGQYLPNKTESNKSSKPIKRYNSETGRLE